MLAANGTTVNHGVLIDGIDVVFVVKWPVSPTGIPWALPDDSQGHAYRDVLEVVDDTGGIAISEEAWDPQGGMMAGGYAQIRLDLTDDVLDVFATRHPAVRKTLLTADLRHDGVGAPADYEQLEVRSTSGFPASGFVHVQNECIYYPAVTGATFGISPTDPCTRRSYVWSTDDRGDFRHESSVDRAEPLLWVADRPLSFRGGASASCSGSVTRTDGRTT
ncbi:MAG: hypothetical protein M5U09_13570 [Gammaproteobacteria bacterium]|nr:hypothetical protein [Gammaproteobacteria bacterium]